MKFSIKIVAFLHRSQKEREGRKKERKERRDSYLCPLSVASVNYILLSIEHCFFYLSLFNLTFISFWEKFYFSKKKLIDDLRHQLDQFSRENISQIVRNFLTLSQRYLTHANRYDPFAFSILFAGHITQLKRVRLRKRSSASPRSFSIFAFDRQIALYGPSINEICNCNAR